MEMTGNGLNDLSFGEAITLAKAGHKVARKGWNGKGMWISYTSGKVLDLKVDDIWTDNVRVVAEENGGKVEIHPYFSMKKANNSIQMGWLASQSDMLSRDWEIVE